jgi:hypothetical protein
VASYWKQTLIASDNRIPAFESSRSVYAFANPATAQTVTVRAELRFRRVFQDLSDAKGWDTPDVVMEMAELHLSAVPWRQVFLPLVRRGH